MSGSRTVRPMPWWFSPRVLTWCVLLPTYVGLWVASELLGLKLSTAKGFSFFHGEAFLHGLAGLLALGYGTLLPVHLLAIRDPRRLGLRPPVGYIYFVGLLAVFGYVWWFRDLATNPSILLDALRSPTFSYQMRASIERSAGLGSLATLGLAFFVLVAHRAWTLREPLPGPLRALAVLLLLMTVFRAFAWAERLALFEVAVVLALFGFGHSERAGRGTLGALRPLVPAVAIAAGVLFFGIGEYFRSWASHYSQHETSFWTFIGQRLVNYYFQALNTGAGMITVLEWPSLQFGNTLDWLHRFPILLGPIFRYIVELQPTFYLERFGDPEFNNPSGLFGVLYDMGLAPAILLLAVTGLLAQSAFRAFREPDNVLGIFFPILYLTVIEFFRYWYLGNSRAFLFILALVGAAMLARAPAGAAARAVLPGAAPAMSGGLR
ncbi:MAG: hypothetical protein ACK54X_11040 [Burkholderiales bacterium]|jgi:hypothetical protein